MRTRQNQPNMVREFDENRHESKNIASYKRMTAVLTPDQDTFVRRCASFNDGGSYNF